MGRSQMSMRRYLANLKELSQPRPGLCPRRKRDAFLSYLSCLAFSLITLTALGSVALAAGASDGLWLITPEEAATADEAEPLIRSRGLGPKLPDAGPMIELLKPIEHETISVPTEVVVRFTPRSAPVDLSTLKVSVVKLVRIDITDRLTAYASPTGIKIPDANLPSGEHKVRITLGDAEGGVTSKEVIFRIP